MKPACAILMLFALGCGVRNSHPATHREEGEHGHSHERGKLMLADVGKYHAGLTAHLSSKTGNELDINIETADAAHKAVPLPLAKLTAKAKVTTGDRGLAGAGIFVVVEHDVVFEPAESDERKDDPPGKCSKFTAKAPWMKAGDTLTITSTIEIDGKSHEVVWSDFNPKKFAHFEE